MNDLRHDLRTFMVTQFLFGDGQGLADGDSFLERGILDSTGVLELVSHLEKTYGFKVPDEDLIPENLDSIDSLVQFVERKRAPTQGTSTPVAPQAATS